MTTTAQEPLGLDACDTASDVLGFARGQQVAADRAEALKLAAVVKYVGVTAPVDEGDVSTWVERGRDTGVSIAGDGAPLVSEFAVVAVAASLGKSHDAGRAYVAEAVEVAHRLPRLWVAVMTGQLPAWRACQVARETMSLPMSGAAFVDAHVAHVAHKIGPAALGRLVEEARTQFDPQAARERQAAAQDSRHFDINLNHVTFDGTVEVNGRLDVADACALEDAVQVGAQALADLGCEESRDVRRSMAVGDIARNQLALDLNPHPDTEPQPDADTKPGSVEPEEEYLDEVGPIIATSAAPPTPRGGVKPQQVVLHVHLSQAAVTGTSKSDCDLARVEQTNGFLLADQVRAWCGNPDTQVVVKPVIDLNDTTGVEAYEVPDRMAEQVRLRSPICVFPYCTRRARTSRGNLDLDHGIPYDEGGVTGSQNLGPLCRIHHRVKTHDPDWSYDTIDPGVYLWHGPIGQEWVVDPTGATRLMPRPATRPPEP